MTDVWQFTGATGITSKFRYVRVTGITTTGRQAAVDMIRRSTAGTGGTPTTVTPAKLDPADGAASTGVKEFTVAASPLGTAVTTVMSSSFIISPDTAAGVIPQTFVEWNFRELTFKPITLSGATDFLCVSLVGIATTTADKFDFEAIFTEQ
jgi:hypothetical protein